MQQVDFSRYPAVAMLDEFLSVPAPPGREDAMAELVRCKLRAIGFEPETDMAGNVLVRMGDSAAAPVIMAAHMDEIALVVSRIEPDGRLRVVRSGGLRPFKIGERLVDIIGDHGVVPGVIAMGAGHTADAVAPDWDACHVTTGCSEAQLRARGIHEGAAMVPARAGRGPLVFGDPDDPLVAAWTFDDRMGMIALLRLLEEIKRARLTPAWPLLAAFTVHEEGGCHGAKILAQREKPAAFIAIDGCPVTPESRLKLDGRPGVWVKDAKTNYDHALVAAFEQAAAAAGVGLQRAVYAAASSDASAVYSAGAAPRVGFIGHVRENSHGFEVARLAVFDNVLKVLARFVCDWPGPAAV